MTQLWFRMHQRLTVGILLIVCTTCAAAEQRESRNTRRASKVNSDMIRIRMPGKSYSGELPAMTEQQVKVRDELRRDLSRLAGVIGERNLNHPENYSAAALFIEKSLTDAGYSIERQSYNVNGHPCMNLSAVITGNEKKDEIVVVGAHYDSSLGTPGANDNGSGVVATLALARMFANRKLARTLRLVFFANEEQPYFQTSKMGSLVYAKGCRERGDNVVGMLSLETIGYYSDKKNSQTYPALLSAFYPSTGNFISFVGNVKSQRLVTMCIGSFRRHARFPSEGGAVPGSIQGVGWSDHWSFWQVGYPAIMVTDTAPFRYPHYHQASDTVDKIDYDSMARVVTGLQGVVADLVNPD